MALRKAFYFRLIAAQLIILLIFFTWNLLNSFSINVNYQRHEISNVTKAERFFYIRQNGKYWILYNYVRAQREFYGNESITYTTHAEYTYLDNLEPLIMRWQAPISIAIFACGSDFDQTLNSIRYLRNCSKSANLIKDMINFHIFFHNDHMPSYIPKMESEIEQQVTNCTELTAHFTLSVRKNVTYRTKNKLLYPINIARNIARHEATTYYVFPLDIELYPSVNFVPEFLQMAHQMKLANKRSVFAIPIFEMQTGYELPNTKTELQKLFKAEIAIPFHMIFARRNHAIPNLLKWIELKEPKEMQVFEVIKRKSDGWESYYVTVNKDEPYFNEHFSYEGRYDKRIQGDVLTLMNYDFIILDKAFLMHRQGIKQFERANGTLAKLRAKMFAKAQGTYRVGLWKLFGQEKYKERVKYLPVFYPKEKRTIKVARNRNAIEEAVLQYDIIGNPVSDSVTKKKIIEFKKPNDSVTNKKIMDFKNPIKASVLKKKKIEFKKYNTTRVLALESDKRKVLQNETNQ